MGQQEPIQQPLRSPWWLAGEETCEFCVQQYSVEVEYRCVDCDRPVCPMCVITVRERHRVWCPECYQALPTDRR